MTDGYRDLFSTRSQHTVEGQAISVPPAAAKSPSLPLALWAARVPSAVAVGEDSISPRSTAAGCQSWQSQWSSLSTALEDSPDCSAHGRSGLLSAGGQKCPLRAGSATATSSTVSLMWRGSGSCGDLTPKVCLDFGDEPSNASLPTALLSFTPRSSTPVGTGTSASRMLAEGSDDAGDSGIGGCDVSLAVPDSNPLLLADGSFHTSFVLHKPGGSGCNDVVDRLLHEDRAGQSFGLQKHRGSGCDNSVDRPVCEEAFCLQAYGSRRRFVGLQSFEAPKKLGLHAGSEHASMILSPSMRRTPSSASNASCDWRMPVFRRSRSCASDTSVDWLGTSAVLRSRSLASDTSLDGNATASVSPGSAIIEACGAPNFLPGSPQRIDSPRCSRQVIPLSLPRDRPRSASPTTMASQRHKYVWPETSLSALFFDRHPAESGSRSVADITSASLHNDGVETRSIALQSQDLNCLDSCQFGCIPPPRQLLTADIPATAGPSHESHRVPPRGYASRFQSQTLSASRPRQVAALGANANNYSESSGCPPCRPLCRRRQSGPAASQRTTPTRTQFSQGANRKSSGAVGQQQPAAATAQIQPRPHSAPRSATRSLTPRRIVPPSLATTADSRFDAPKVVQSSPRTPACTTFRLHGGRGAPPSRAPISKALTARAPSAESGRQMPANSAGAAGKVAQTGHGPAPRIASSQATSTVAARFRLIQANVEEPRKAGEISLF